MTTDPQNIPCSKLHGVGVKTLEKLHKLNLISVLDLLFHLPSRYEDRTKISPISQVSVGKYGVIVGTIVDSSVVRHGRLILYCTLQDASGSLRVCFFNFSRQKLQFRLKPGVKLYCYGELRWVGNAVVMVHPDYRILKPDEEPPLVKNLTPVYPTTEGLSQTVLRKLISQAINIAKDNQDLFEYFPSELLQQLKFPNLVDALCFIHLPGPNLDLNFITSRDHPMRARLIFEELLALQLSLLRLRLETKAHLAVPLLWDEKVTTKFLSSLPFSLTNGQLKVIQEIASDLRQPKPMLRLLQGDVGCGKTIVAALTIAQVINCGYQAAIMAPTELLAEQHFKNISHWCHPGEGRDPVVLLSGKIKGKTRDEILTKIADGSAQVIVGTHALFQEKITFNHLALIVIDEQHRFGVHQSRNYGTKGLKIINIPTN